MEHRPFGRTGLDVSAVGFGCWEVGGGYGQVDEAEFGRAVSAGPSTSASTASTPPRATAWVRRSARWARRSASRRDEAVVVTKFGMDYRDKPNMRDSSRERVKASIDKSLKNLGTDYVDVYLVHWPDRLTPFEDTMGALDDVVREGKVRFVGLSNFKRDEIEACMQVRRVDVVQYGYNMFDRRMQREILPYCEEQGIGFMGYGSLAYGLLTGTFTEDQDFGSEDWRARQGKMGSIKLFESLFGAESFPNNVRAVNELKGIAARYDRSLPATRVALGNLPSRRSAPRWWAAATSPRSRTTPAAVGFSIKDDDLAEIDAIFARHGVDTAPDFWIEDD